MADKLFLIDGMAFAFRSYYAIRSALTDSKGRPTNAVFGFARVLMKLLREHDPSHIAVVFDAPGKTFRDEIYPEYKANRSETPQDLKDQFPMMHELVDAMNLTKFVVPGVEADDVMGTLAEAAAAEGMETVLVTGDKDMLQLITDEVQVYDPAKGDSGKWYSDEDVKERFGVGPVGVIDALALIGDSADNVPGVRGIGEKTAKKLLEQFGSLDGLYENIESLKGKQKEKLEEDKEQAYFSRELVTIKTDVECDTDLDALKRQPWDDDVIIEHFTALEFHGLLEELVPNAAAQEEEELDYQLVVTAGELDAVVAAMKKHGCFAVDTETTSTDPMRAELVGISLSCEACTGYYIPVAHTAEACSYFTDPDDLSTITSVEQLPFAVIQEKLGPLLLDEAVGKVGHNIKYDLIVLERAGLEVLGVTMDTMVASYLTDPSRLRHNLDEVSLQYLRRKTIPISEVIGKGSKAVTFNHVPVDRACVYASEDADITWRLFEVLDGLLKERELDTLFQDVELPLIDVLRRMEQTGVAIDLNVFQVLQEEIQSRLVALESEIHSLAGEPFNINSPKQLQGILFEKIGLKPIKKTKTGYSTNESVLEQLSHEHPLPEKILEYRMLEKLRGTYVEALPKCVHPETGRIHTSFNQAVAATGRLASSDPNLQNIPVRTEYGRRIREAFVCSGPNRVLISADYSQIELRILAHLSDDAALKEAFFNDMDIHSDTASRVFGVDPDGVDSEQRRQAKAVNFGVVYGISAFGLSRNLGIGMKEAQEFIDAYFAQYPDVRRWLDQVVVDGKEQGYVTTLLNRRRYVPDLKSSDVNQRKATERAAINTPVQGSAADVIKVAMIALDGQLAELDAQMVLQVHDELVVDAPKENAEAVATLMRETMEKAIELSVPLKVDLGIGQHWAEIH